MLTAPSLSHALDLNASLDLFKHDLAALKPEYKELILVNKDHSKMKACDKPISCDAHAS
jgi:hypothetical protein